MTALTILMLVAAYLLGSVSSAVLICRLFNLPDPRTVGSGNPGATNVYRLGGKIPASLVFVCDMLKGTIPVWGSYWLGLSPIELGFIGIAACLGHMYPLYFEFKGGKGVATAFGAMLPIGYDLSLVLIFSWVLGVRLSGFSSVGAAVSVLLAPLATYIIKPEYVIPVSLLSLLILGKHRSNFARLLRKEESKIWQKGKIKE